MSIPQARLAGLIPPKPENVIERFDPSRIRLLIKTFRQKRDDAFRRDTVSMFVDEVRTMIGAESLKLAADYMEATLDYGSASAIEARSDATGTGAAEGEGAVAATSGETPSPNPEDQ